jgi:hypothetical protein
MADKESKTYSPIKEGESKTGYAIRLLENGEATTKSEAARVAGINAATVGANYGATGEKAAERRKVYQARNLYYGQKFVDGEIKIGDIAKKTGLSVSKINALVKGNKYGFHGAVNVEVAKAKAKATKKKAEVEAESVNEPANEPA